MKDSLIVYKFDESQIFSAEGIYAELHNTEYTLPHFHTFYEIVFVTKGEMTQHIHILDDNDKSDLVLQQTDKQIKYLNLNPDKFKQETLTVGTVQIISQNTCHFYNFDKNQAEYVNVAISQQWFETYLNILKSDKLTNFPKTVCVSQSETERLKSLFLEAIEVGTQNESDKNALLKVLVCELFKNFISQSKDMESNVPKWLRELTALLNTTEYYLQSVEEILSTVPYSHSHICKEFKHYFGVSFKSYFVKQKLKHACYLLANSNMKIIDIANSLGYSNSGFFAGVFYKNFGISPSDYRKRFSDSYSKDLDV